jgi:SAM-dependent methyltransferase
MDIVSPDGARAKTAAVCEEVSHMNDEMHLGRGQIPAPYPPKSHWEYNLYEYHEGLSDQGAYEFMAKTPGVTTAEYWKDWCQAIFYAGTTRHVWNEVPELKAAFLSAASVEKDQNVVLIGKYLEETGLEAALASLLRSDGHLAGQDITSRVVQSVRSGSPYKGTQLQWDFDYLDSTPDHSIDRVILFNAASHVADWDRFAKQVDRVIRRGGRLVVAEAPLGGKEFREALHQDSHYESYILRVLSGLGVTEDELPDIGPEALTALFEPDFDWTGSFSHQGVYLFCARRRDPEPPGDEEERFRQAYAFPRNTPAVRRFLDVVATDGPWSPLTEEEQEVWGSTVKDIHTPHLGKAAVWSGGSLLWNFRNQRGITDIMWSNLAAKAGDKILVIAEFPEDLGNLEEVEKRVGPAGEIVLVSITSSPKSYDYKGWQAKRRQYMEQGSPEEWPYDFADDYPDDYFDVIFLPQGVHHCNNWLRDAPRLLRALKPRGQVMAIECGINRPQMATARELSALARVVGDRVFKIALPEWLVGPLSPEGPLPPGTGYEHVGRPYHDVSVEHLRESFGEGVTDACGLEYKGWILYWAFKR